MDIMSLLSESEEHYNDLNSHSSYGRQRLKGHSRYNRDFLSYAPQEVEIERTLSNPYGFPLFTWFNMLQETKNTLINISRISVIAEVKYYFGKKDITIER